MLNKINKIKPELKFKIIKKFQEDLNYSFLFKKNKSSNKKLLNWSTYNTLNFLQRSKRNIIVGGSFRYSYVNQDFEFFKEKSKIFCKRLSIYYFFCKLMHKNKKNFNLNLKNLKPLITSILLKSFLLTIKKKLGTYYLFKIISNFKYYFYLIKNLNFKNKFFNLNFFNDFFKFFYNIQIFFLYKSLFFIKNKKKKLHFLQKNFTSKKWFSILINRFFDETLNLDINFNIKKIKNKKFRIKIEKTFFFYYKYKLKKKSLRNKILLLNSYLNLKNIDLNFFKKFKNLNIFLKNSYLNSYKIEEKKTFKIFPIVQSLITLKYVNKALYIVKKYKYILKKSLNLNLLNKNSNLYLKIFKIYLKNLKFLYLVINDFKVRSKFLKILNYGKYQLKIKNKKNFFLYRKKKRRINKKFRYFFRKFLKKKPKRRFLKKKIINNDFLLKHIKFSNIFSIRKKVKNNTKNNYMIYSKKSLFKHKMLYLQKLSFFLGKIKKKFIKKYIQESLKIKNNSVNAFLISLESRIDVILFRLGFFRSFNEIKIFIKEGNLILNNKKILKSCSSRLKRNDIFKIKNKEKIMFRLLKDSNFFLSSVFQIPEYIEFNFYIFSGIFLEDILNVNKVYYPISVNRKNLVLKNSEIFRDILK